MRPLRAAATLILLPILATAACAPRQGRLQTAPRAGQEELRPQPGAFVARWKGRAESGEGARSFRLGLLGAPPDRFVLELSGRIGGPVLRAAHDGSRMQVLLIRDRLFIDEPAGAEVVEGLLGFPFEAGTLLSVMIGRLLPPPYPGVQGAAPAPWAGAGELSLGPAGWPAGGSLGVPGAEPVEVSYGAFVSAGSEGGVLPEEIELSWSGRGSPLAARLTLRSSHAVSAASPDQFRLTPPRGFRQVGLKEVVGEGSLLLSAVEAGDEEETEEISPGEVGEGGS